MEFYISRYKDLRTREFKLEVLTPMFLGGANNKTAELRTQSVKGMLRFWWRAVNERDNWRKIKKEEDELFGSTKGKSKVHLRIEGEEIEKANNLPKGDGIRVRVGGNDRFLDVLKYLSFGTRNREYIEPGSKFKLVIEYPQDKEGEILKAFRAFINYGGLGSRSRNGFGCMRVVSGELPGWDPKSFLNEFGNERLKDFTSFSNKSELFLIKHEFSNWKSALSKVGEIYFNARRSLERSHQYRKRSFIAKPITQAGEKFIKKGRHSKPYFIHISKDNERKYKAQILFLPYKYNDPHDTRSVNEYLQVCEEFNQKIREEIKKLSENNH